ncbi:MAG TPA: hypothetical protein VMW24_17760, partial [Sedimentisphaerales bacterium]|nr:hypothetical protein [Sedimentisphaerales bacterium]
MMLLLFLPCKAEFHRKTSLLSGRFTSAWAALIFAVLMVSVLLGFFSYKHVEYSDQLWWRFAVNGDAPRFLRATLGASVLILLYGIARLMAPASPKAAAANTDTLQVVESIVARSPRTCVRILSGELCGNIFYIPVFVPQVTGIETGQGHDRFGIVFVPSHSSP